MYFVFARLDPCDLFWCQSGFGPRAVATTTRGLDCLSVRTGPRDEQLVPDTFVQYVATLTELAIQLLVGHVTTAQNEAWIEPRGGSFSCFAVSRHHPVRE